MKTILLLSLALLLLSIYAVGLTLSATGVSLISRGGLISASTANQPTLATAFNLRGSFQDDNTVYRSHSTEYISFPTVETMSVGVRDTESGNLQFTKEYMCGGYCARETGEIEKCGIRSEGDSIFCSCGDGFKHSGCIWIPQGQ